MKKSQCQIIYVTSWGVENASCISVVFTMRLVVYVMLEGLGENYKVRKYGVDDDLLWNIHLEETIFGT